MIGNYKTNSYFKHGVSKIERKVLVKQVDLPLYVTEIYLYEYDADIIMEMLKERPYLLGKGDELWQRR